MQNLVDGLRAYRRDVHSSKGELFASLADGQSPTTLFMTCSDSRVVPALADWLEIAQSTKVVVDATMLSECTTKHRLTRAVQINALFQLDNLRTHPSVAAAPARNTLMIHARVYDIRTASVGNCREDTGTFAELNETSPTV